MERCVLAATTFASAKRSSEMFRVVRTIAS
jgi:hypothetical protein